MMQLLALMGGAYAVSLSTMDCGAVGGVCGVVALESGFGPGLYHHDKPGVHGLWPQVPPYGNSQCVAPDSTAVPTVVYPCYVASNTTAEQQITFEAHEWTKHGVCAGVADEKDFFDQLCEMTTKPLLAMAGQNSLAAMQSAVQDAGFEVYQVDNTDMQLLLSACRTSKGKWILANQSSFASLCGGGPVVPTPAPASQCVTGQHGPLCTTDVFCQNITDCVRCASSGFCTDVPLW